MDECDRNLRLAALDWVKAKHALEHYGAPKSGGEFDVLIRAYRDADKVMEAAIAACAARAAELRLTPEGVGLEALKDNLMIHLVEAAGGEIDVSAAQIDGAKDGVLTLRANGTGGLTAAVARKL